MYAEVAVYQAPVQRTFHYAIPDGFNIQVGQLVEVNFRTGRSQAIVVALSEESPVLSTKPLLDIVLHEPVVTPTQIQLALWMATYTLSPLGACLWLMLPPGLAKRGDSQYTLISPEANDDNPLVAQVLDLLRERGPLRAAQLDKALPRTRWKDKLRPLIERGVIQREAVLAMPHAKAQQVKIARLALDAADVPAALDDLKRSPRQADVLRYLAAHDEPQLVNQVMNSVAATADTFKRLADKGWIILEDTEQMRDPLAGREFADMPPPVLTVAQATCWQAIRDHMDHSATDPTHQNCTFLLQGVTGSGKTEVYLRALEHCLNQGRQAIILVPEIALVPQTVQRFASRFPGRVSVLHSGLTDGEQYDTWRRARNGEFDVVIGARSALFMPLVDIGLVVMDEEHDDSYKQSPPLPPPYYHAREVAHEMMRINHGTVILGSATPSVITVFQAEQGHITALQLPQRIILSMPEDASTPQISGLPPVQVVDMRHELRAGNRTMFSRALRTALQHVLQRGEQAILFLNRRGSATFVLCRDCGYVARCPHCEMPLTYHQANSALICHSCNYHTAQPQLCPECGSVHIRYFGAGTASVEEAVLKEFAPARVLRWDRDTTQDRGAHESIMTRFADGEADVLVGTQMIVKGLDLPRVTLVGVVLADTALGLPDYRAGERTFQLLTQAAGRAGRSTLRGQVIFQTYQPDHYAIRAASQHDYSTFYAQEISYRQALHFPPYRRLVRFLFRDHSPVKAQQAAEQTTELLQRRIKDRQLLATELIGPAPTFFGRSDDVFQWHVIVRTTDPLALVGDYTPKTGSFIDVDPLDVL